MATRAAERADWLPVLVVTGAVAAACVPLVVAMPMPALASLWIVSLVARSLAPVHQHCHAHYKIFGSSIANAAYDVVLMLAAGNVTAVWELQHVHGHHQAYLARSGDPANNDRFGTGRGQRLVFTILGDALSFTDSLAIARRQGRSAARLWRQQLGQIAVLAGLAIYEPVITVAFFVLPAVLLRWAVFWFSYAQHDDVPRADVYSGSVTHFGWTNGLYLNVGHHTAHHEKPTLHWSRLPARTAQILERIPASCLR